MRERQRTEPAATYRDMKADQAKKAALSQQEQGFLEEEAKKACRGPRVRVTVPAKKVALSYATR